MPLINLRRNVVEGDRIYRLRISEVDSKFGPSGYEYLTMQLEVTKPDDFAGITFSDMLSLSPAARFRVDQFLDALNAPNTGSVPESWFVGKYGWGEVTIDTSRDIPRPRVNKWLPNTPDDAELIAEEAKRELERASGSAGDEAEIGELAGVAGDSEDDPFA